MRTAYVVLFLQILSNVWLSLSVSATSLTECGERTCIIKVSKSVVRRLHVFLPSPEKSCVCAPGLFSFCGVLWIVDCCFLFVCFFLVAVCCCFKLIH